MPRKKGLSIFISYAYAEQPDPVLFAELTKKAIGPDRSLTNFADLCNLSPSTVSRIINQQFKTTSSDEVIKAIADNADPRSGVTADLLLKAQGRVPIQFIDARPNHKGSTASSRKDTHSICRRKPSSLGLYHDVAREIIQTNLLKKGYHISLGSNRNLISLPGLQYRADFIVELTADNTALEFDKWAFDVHMNGIRPIMHKVSWIFGAAYLESFRERRIKVSLIVDNPTEYEEVKKLLQNIQINDFVSIILIDANKRCIIQEFQIPTKDGFVTKPLLIEQSQQCGEEL